MSAITLGAVAGIGSLVGTVGNDPLIRAINTEMGSGDFFNTIDDMLSRGRKCFVENIIKPFRLIGDTVKNIVGRFEVDEIIIPITTEDQLRRIPICMQAPILHYAPIRKLFDEGRIFGFGHTVIPDGDPYGRLINNGTVKDVLGAMDKTGEFEFVYEFKSTDPDLSYDELESIEETREYLDWLLENSEIDPTDPMGNVRG